MSGIIFMRVNVLEFLRKKQTFNNVKKNIKLHGNYTVNKKRMIRGKHFVIFI